MSVLARWVPCTPTWLHVHGICDIGVRRPVLEVCELNPDHFHTIGHEHLMVGDSVIIDQEEIQ